MCIKRISPDKIREYREQDYSLSNILIPTEGFGSQRQWKKLGIGMFKALCLSTVTYSMRFATSKDSFFHTIRPHEIAVNFALAAITDNVVDAIFEKISGYDLAPSPNTSVKLVNSQQLRFRHLMKLSMGTVAISLKNKSLRNSFSWYLASRIIDVSKLTIAIFSPYRQDEAILHDWEKELKVEWLKNTSICLAGIRDSVGGSITIGIARIRNEVTQPTINRIERRVNEVAQAAIMRIRRRVNEVAQGTIREVRRIGHTAVQATVNRISRIGHAAAQGTIRGVRRIGNAVVQATAIRIERIGHAVVRPIAFRIGNEIIESVGWFLS